MSGSVPQVQPNRGMNPMALAVSDAARLLSAVGGQAVTPDMLDTDLAAGAPANADGTINLVHYAAWLVRQAAGVGPRASGFREEADDATRSLTPEARSPRAGGSHA